MYDNGEGVPKDDAEAVKWYRLAADQGYALPQFNLGLMYDNGEGVPKDDAEAVKWYRLAADQGYALPQFNLGLKYFNGEGVPKDLVQAHAWWNIAGASGDEDAKKNLAIVEKQMTSEQKAEAMKLAREMFARIEAKKK
jgi:TPR repeat protein